jgi:hypothetical protein
VSYQTLANGVPSYENEAGLSCADHFGCAILSAVMLIGSRPGAAPAPTLAPGGRTYGPGGPQDNFVYINSDGIFEFGPIATQHAIYKWSDGHTYVDTLEYDKPLTLKDRWGNPANAWVFKATSANGNSWWLAFGYQPVGQINGTDVFPLWYSFNGDGQTDFTRWLTDTGTTRIKLP